jgi:hypothetical protein
VEPQIQQKLIQYCLEAATDDLQSAKEIISKTKSYTHGLFLLHLPIEKILKALYVQTFAQHAPQSHNLLNLVQKCGLEIPEQKFEITLTEVNQFNIDMRYPADIKALKLKASYEYADIIIFD